MKQQSVIIAIDGHSSCGKSTVAKDLAKQLQLIYIDSGAMYRSVTLFALQNGMLDNGNIDVKELKNRLTDVHISFQFDVEKRKNITFLNDSNVEDLIRGIEVSQNVSAISTLAFVREHLVEQQREMGDKGGIVMDGRDIGTVVFPHAHLKIFMTASATIRAQRRYDELTAKGENVSFDEILDNVKQRDHIDSTRDVSPLKQADDALVLDNSNLTKDEQLEWIVEKLRSKQLV